MGCCSSNQLDFSVSIDKLKLLLSNNLNLISGCILQFIQKGQCGLAFAIFFLSKGMALHHQSVSEKFSNFLDETDNIRAQKQVMMENQLQKQFRKSKNIHVMFLTHYKLNRPQTVIKSYESLLYQIKKLMQTSSKFKPTVTQFQELYQKVQKNKCSFIEALIYINNDLNLRKIQKNVLQEFQIGMKHLKLPKYSILCEIDESDSESSSFDSSSQLEDETDSFDSISIQPGQSIKYNQNTLGLFRSNTVSFNLKEIVNLKESGYYQQKLLKMGIQTSPKKDLSDFR